MEKKKNYLPIKVLIALNIVAILFFGVRHLIYLKNLNDTRRKEAVSNANIVAEMGLFNKTDGVRLFELADKYENGENASDDELDWMIQRITKNESADYVKQVSRRRYLLGALRKSIPRLNHSQKNRLFDALLLEMKMDDPQFESGTDITIAAKALSLLGDRRAVEVLRPYLNDPRSEVHLGVEKSIKVLQGVTNR